MTFTTIALQVEPDTLGAVDAEIAFALALAKAHSAHVTALVYRATALGGGSGERNDLPEEQLVAREDAVALHVQQALESRGLRFDVRGRSSFAHGVGEVFADQMRVSDLGVMSYASGADIGRRFVATGGIFSSGRPLLLVPPGTVATVPSRIVVAWDATPAAVRAIHGAMPLLRQAETVTVVSVTDDKEFRPGQSGVELTHLLARHGARATFQPVQRGRSSVTRIISDVTREVGAGLLVMGAVRHAPLHNLLFGTATMDLLDRGPSLPTLLAA